jgi:hypothetical protein
MCKFCDYAMLKQVFNLSTAWLAKRCLLPMNLSPRLQFRYLYIYIVTSEIHTDSIVDPYYGSGSDIGKVSDPDPYSDP